MTVHWRDAIGVVAAIVAASALVPYVRSILAGRTKPNRASWWIWALIGCAIAASYKASGASATFWIALVYAAMSLTVALLSIRYGTGGASALDLCCLAGCLLSLWLWWRLRSAPAALYLNICMDALGMLPTLRKVWRDPRSEDRLAWSIASLAAGMNLFAIDSPRPQVWLHPLHAFLGNGLIAALLFRQRRLA